MNKISSFFTNNYGLIVALFGYSVFFIMFATFINFVSYEMLIFLLMMFPMFIVGIIHKNKKLIIKRFKGMGWALIIVILLLFPAFWLIPQQIWARVNRQSVLITPNAPAVQVFASDFRNEYTAYDSLSFNEKILAVRDFALEKVAWKLDYETYGISGHIATPTECINLGADDCQGQAVTMASLFLYLGFEYVWAVETPFHWWVLIRDPAKGELPVGWERNVETLVDTGELITVNRAGHLNSMPEWSWEEIVMIFNNEETLFPVSLFEAILIALTTTPYFHIEFEKVFTSPSIVIMIFAMILLALPAIGWTSYMSYEKESVEKIEKRTNKKSYLFKSILVGCLFFGVMTAWYLLDFVILNYSLIMSIGLFATILILSSEAKFWRIIGFKE